MIETLSLRNFKVLRELDVRLRPLTLVVGPNASGKSSLLQALACLMECLTQDGVSGVRNVFLDERSPDILISRAADESLAMECSGRFGGFELAFRLKVSPNYSISIQGWLNRAEFSAGRFPAEMKAAIRSAVDLHLDVKLLATPCYLREITRVLPSSGWGLPWVLAHLKLEDISRFREIEERLRSIVPVVQALQLRQTYVTYHEMEERGGEKVQVVRRDVGYELLFDMKGAEAVPAHAVSQGTLLTLGLLTVLSSPAPPQLVLIDDLERGLHPRAMGDLVQQLRLLQQQSPELQIVATSHSPYLLDYLQADEILLTSLSDDGYAAVRPLTDHPEYERWKDVMAPGEFWSTVGERWVTEQAPR